MGVFTTSKQFRLALNLTSQWWLAGVSVDLDFRNGQYYDSSLSALKQPLAVLTDYLSCSRASTGYAKTSTGLLMNFGNNVLRQTDLGLLIEDARTNLVVYSQDCSQAGFWGAVQGSFVSSNSDPLGTSTAFKMVENTNNANHVAQYSDGSNYTGQFTFSVFVKAAGRTTPAIQMHDNLTGPVSVNADLVAGTVGTPSIAGTWSAASATIDAYANGWYRVSVTGTKANSTIILARVDLNQGNSYAGDGSSGILVWGAQIEQSVGFPSSYIPTAGATATRAQDLITVTGALDTLLAASASSALMDVIISNVAGGDRLLQNASAVLSINNNSSALLFDQFNNQSPSSGSFASGTFSTGVKVIFGQNTSGRSIAGGGGSVGTDSFPNPFPSGTRVFYQGGSFFSFGYLRRFAAWNSRLSDATLTALSA